MEGLLTLLIGFVLGALVVWLALRTRLSHEYERAKAESMAQVATLTERLAGKDHALTKLQEAFDKQIAESEAVNVKLTEARAALEGERRAAMERVESFRQAGAELTEKFKALSRDALRDNNQSFLQLAKSTLETIQETAKGELELRKNAIDELVKPLRESLDRVDGKIGEMEKARVGAYSELREQVRSLASSQLQLQMETGNLVKALRAPQVRGRWGEIQLRRVIELAGMVEYCDFVEQETVATEDGRFRPDVIVRLPGNRTIVVDAKVPFEAFYESISTTDEEVRCAKLKDHAKIVRSHIGFLSRKSYWESVQPTPEFVLLFLPGETFFTAALENDPKLIEDGVNQRVIIATPTTLIALLKAVSYGWRQEQMANNAQEVGRLGKDLYDRLRTFTSHFADIGRGLERALDAYNRGVGSLEARVLVAARRFKERGAIAGDEIDVVEPLDKTARPLSLDEGGLFPDLVAVETHADQLASADIEAEDAESAAPLLSSRSASVGET